IMSFPVASMISAFGSWRLFPICFIVSPSIKTSASKVSESVIKVPFLIKIAIRTLLCIVRCLKFFDSQQRNQHFWRNIHLGQVGFIKLLGLRSLAQRVPEQLSLIAVYNEIIERFCFEQVFASCVFTRDKL